MSIADSQVSPRTVGDVLRPDLTISASGPSTLEFEAESVPAGVIESSEFVPAADGKLRATATAVIPPGMSRFFIQALWTP